MASKRTVFFKPILSVSLRDKLMLPTRFVKKYGGDVLPDTAFLKLPNGAEWKVDLEKGNGEQVWFANGWKEFAEYYSLFDGRLVVFGYNHSTCCFHVLILDLTTSLEIQYPSIHSTEAKGSLCTKRKNYDDSLLPCKRKRVVQKAFNSQEADLHHSTTKSKGDMQGMFDSKFLTCKVVKGNSALERANAFKSQNPSFVWVAKRSHIHTRSNFRLPSNFARSFLGSKKNGESTNLVMLDGRVWVAKYIVRKICTNTVSELSIAGFRAFSKANDLKVGDVCVFELMGGTPITFQVLIFRNTGDSDTHTPLFEGQSREANTEEQRKKEVAIKTETTEITCSGNEGFGTSKTLQLPSRNRKFIKRKISEGAASDNFNSQNPFFKITIGKSHSPGIPAWFAKKYLKVGEHIAEVKVEERWWSVKVIFNEKPTHHSYFSSGWTAFVRQNRLQLGDSCSFYFINCDRDHKMIMRVSIFKDSSARRSYLIHE